MNGQITKKIKQFSRRQWRKYVSFLYALPLKNRLLWAFQVVFKK